MSTLTYRKTKTGQWVVYGPTALMSSDWVTVTKRDGSTKREFAPEHGKPFTVDGVECCYAYPQRPVATVVTVHAAPAASDTVSTPSQHPDKGGLCDECERPRKAANLWAATDMSGISGYVCTTCLHSGSLSFM